MKRRHIVKLSAAAGGGVLFNWTKPIVNIVLLPVHAQTSCILVPQPTPPLPGVTVHAIGEQSITVGDVNRITADITFDSSSIVFSLLLNSNTTLTMESATVSCSGSISTAQITSLGNTYEVNGTVTNINAGEYTVQALIAVSGGLSVTATANILTTVQNVGP